MISKTFKQVRIIGSTIIQMTPEGIPERGPPYLLFCGEEGSKSRYMLKGLRGLINHSMMAIARKEGLEVCHSTHARKTKDGDEIVLDGFHPNGACYPENECIKHRLMGSPVRTSILQFEPALLFFDSPKKLPEENPAPPKSKDKSSLPELAVYEFGKDCFEKEFILAIELTEELSNEELGFLLKAVLYAPELGLRGSRTKDLQRLPPLLRSEPPKLSSNQTDS